MTKFLSKKGQNSVNIPVYSSAPCPAAGPCDYMKVF